MYSYGPPHMAKQKQDDQLEHTSSSYVRIRDVALKTNAPQSTNYTATNLPSRKLSKLDEPDMQDTTGVAETSS